MAKQSFTLQSVLDLRRSSEARAAARLALLQARVAELEVAESALRAQLGQWHAWRNQAAREHGGGRLAALAAQLPMLSEALEAAEAATRAAVAERQQGEAEWTECRKGVLALEKLESQQRAARNAARQRAEDRRIEDWVLLQDHAGRNSTEGLVR